MALVRDRGSSGTGQRQGQQWYWSETGTAVVLVRDKGSRVTGHRQE